MSAIYRPTAQKEDFDTDGLIDALKKGKTDDGASRSRNAPRSKPVQFEKDAPESGGAAADPFGLDEFLSEAKAGKKG